MLYSDSLRRQTESRTLLYEMSETYMDEDRILEVVSKLKELYKDDFRHNYSQFFPMIVDMSRDDNIYSIEYLSENLESSRAIVEKNFAENNEEENSLHKHLLKLSDHLTLEIGRYNYYSQSEQKIEDLEKRNQTLQVELKKQQTICLLRKNPLFQ